MKTKVFTNKAYQDFTCIGPECEMTCCHSWSVNIDSVTNKKYKTLEKSGDSDFDNFIIAHDGSNYINFDKDGYCPMLTSKGLCKIVCKLGEDYLSKTCDRYPRQRLHLPNSEISQLSVALSCPEASRLTIFRESDSDSKLLNSENELLNSIAAPTNIIKGFDSDHEKLLHRLNHKSLTLIKLKGLPLKRKILALLLLLAGTGNQDFRKNRSECIKITQKIDQLVESKLSNIPDLPGNIANQFNILVQLAGGASRLAFSEKKPSPFYEHMRLILRESHLGLGIKNTNNINQENFQIYTNTSREIITPYFESKPHILENLFGYHLQKGTIFLQPGKTPMQGLVITLLYTLLITGLSHGYAAYHGEINDERFNTLVYSIHRFIDHSEGMKAGFESICQQIEATSIGQLYTFFA